MTILEKIKFEEDWLSEVNLTKENIKIAFAGIRATALESQSWIPCSERLPEERAYYLITVKIDGMNGCKPYYEIQTSWYSDKQFVVEYIGDGLVAKRSVVAWMPLPQPYKAERENQ